MAKPTLTQQLREEAQAHIAQLKDELDNLEAEHNSDLYDAEDTAFDEAMSDVREAEDKMEALMGEVNERYWEPCEMHRWGGSGVARGDLVRRYTSKNLSSRAVEQALHELRDRDVEFLEASAEWQALDARRSAVTHDFFSERHSFLHEKMSEVQQGLSRWKRRLRDCDERAWVSQEGKRLAEEQRRAEEEYALSLQVQEAKELIIRGEE